MDKIDEYKLNNKLFRAKLIEKSIKIKDIAKILKVSPQCLNKRILNSKLYITDIFVLLEILDLKFEEVFKKI